jgi:methionyl-tRNA formyltransferase
LGHEVIGREEKITPEYLEKTGIEFIISSGYALIIRPPIPSLYRKRIINLHISFLPYGRGIYPNFWSFFDGTPKGVSIHCIDEDIDTGEILFQQQVLFSADDTLKTSHGKLMSALEDLFYLKWPELEKGYAEAVKQKDFGDKGTYHTRIESERFIDLLPRHWDTPVSLVSEMGAEFLLAAEFWDQYEQERQHCSVKG